MSEKGIEAEYWYDLVYSMDSSYVHSDISSSKGFFKEIDGFMYIVDGPQVFEATEITSKASELTRGLLMQVYKNWDLTEDKVKEVWEKTNELIIDEFNEKKKKDERVNKKTEKIK